MRVFNLHRSKYIKKIGKFKICEFCNPKNIKEQKCKNLSGKFWRVFVSKYPYLDGNVLVIPIRHIENIEQLTKEEWAELHQIFKQTKKKLGGIFKTKDFNIGLNLGKGAGASIEHLHWQVIPRNRKVLMNATNLLADLYTITISSQDLKRMIEKKFPD